MGTPRYWLRQRTKVTGTFTAEQIKGFLHRGTVARFDKVSCDGMTWEAIGNTPHIVDLLRVADPLTSDPEPLFAVEVEARDPRVWHYTRRGERARDPVDTDTLRRLVRAAEVGAKDQVWTDGFGDSWRTVESVECLANDLPAPPAADDFERLKNLRPPTRRRRKRGWL